MVAIRIERFRTASGTESVLKMQGPKGGKVTQPRDRSREEGVGCAVGDRGMCTHDPKPGLS